ncbi:hypothetical protein GS836_24695 [Rhodococcus hoagii]|nr:hypothetical protein [Prescottella equi]
MSKTVRYPINVDAPQSRCRRSDNVTVGRVDVDRVPDRLRHSTAAHDRKERSDRPNVTSWIPITTCPTLTGAPEEHRCPIQIGDGARVSTRSVVLPGVTIHPGAAVGAGSLVKHDCEPHSLYAGTRRRRFGTYPSEAGRGVHTWGRPHQPTAQIGAYFLANSTIDAALAAICEDECPPVISSRFISCAYGATRGANTSQFRA